MIKHLAIAAGLAALLGTSAAALAGSSITLNSTPLEQPKPVAVDGQASVVDYLGGGVVAGSTSGTTATPVATTSTTVASSTSTTVDISVDVGTAIRVSVSEDDPRWDCHTMGNRICGPGHD